MSGLLKERYFAERFTIIRVIVAMGPTLAVTDRAGSGLCLGLVTFGTLTASLLVILAVRSLVPVKLRGFLLTITVVTLAAVAGMLLQVAAPDCYARLSLLLPLVAVNCLILHRWEAAFAAVFPGANLRQGIEAGLVYTAALVVLGIVREFLSLGSVFGRQIIVSGILVLPPAIFIVFGLLLFGINLLTGKAG